MQKVIQEKRAWYRKLPSTEDIEAYERYKRAKKEVKKVVSEARGKYLTDLYKKLGTREGERYV